MSLKDFRQLIDIHGGAFIGVECSDGVTIEVGINGDVPMKVEAAVLREKIMPRMRERINEMLKDGFKKFEFSFGQSSIMLNYYDAGQVLDAMGGALRHIE